MQCVTVESAAVESDAAAAAAKATIVSSTAVTLAARLSCLDEYDAEEDDGGGGGGGGRGGGRTPVAEGIVPGGNGLLNEISPLVPRSRRSSSRLERGEDENVEPEQA